MKKSKIILPIFLLILTSFFVQAFGQKDYKPPKTREVQLSFPDSSLIFYIQTKKTKVKVKEDLSYHWFKNDQIQINQGGFSGYLLNGKYSMFDINNKLRTLGSFKLGLKDGTWIVWNINGTTSSTVNWEKGEKSGLSKFYDGNGNLKREIPYRKNKIHGKMLVFQANTVEKIKYKNGKIISRTSETISEHESKFKFLKVFSKSDKNKKDKQPSNETGKVSFWKKLFKPKNKEKDIR